MIRMCNQDTELILHLRANTSHRTRAFAPIFCQLERSIRHPSSLLQKGFRSIHMRNCAAPLLLPTIKGSSDEQDEKCQRDGESAHTSDQIAWLGEVVPACEREKSGNERAKDQALSCMIPCDLTYTFAVRAEYLSDSRIMIIETLQQEVCDQVKRLVELVNTYSEENN